MVALFLVCARSQLSHAAQLGPICRNFLNPPDDSRILMRWWWFGPAVTKLELARELGKMKEGGIGGVEVQPVYPVELDDPARGFRNFPYLSDEFIDDLRFAAGEARRLGLRMDVTLGSGWPFGGPHLPLTQAAGAPRNVKTPRAPGAQSIARPHNRAGDGRAPCRGREEVS